MSRENVRNHIRYLRAAPWPHITALFSLALTIALGLLAHDLLLSAIHAPALFFALWAGCWAFVCVFALADGVARHQEYLRIRALLQRFGYHDRIVSLFSGSRCQRDAALRAACESDCLPHARNFFQAQGYRWYHFFPDSVMRNPLTLFTPTFLRTTLAPGRAHPCALRRGLVCALLMLVPAARHRASGGQGE